MEVGTSRHNYCFRRLPHDCFCDMGEHYRASYDSRSPLCAQGKQFEFTILSDPVENFDLDHCHRDCLRGELLVRGGFLAYPGSATIRTGHRQHLIRPPSLWVWNDHRYSHLQLGRQPFPECNPRNPGPQQRHDDSRHRRYGGCDTCHPRFS